MLRNGANFMADTGLSPGEKEEADRCQDEESRIFAIEERIILNFV